MLTICEHDGVDLPVRGTVEAYDAPGGAVTLSILPLEEYVRSVISAEVSWSWGLFGGRTRAPQGHEWGFQALEAQAVATRSYAAAELASGGWAPYATSCDAYCQSYAGMADENSMENEAVADTAGEILEQVATTSPAGTTSTTVPRSTLVSPAITAADPAPVFAQYSASSGGYTVNGAFPGVADRGDSVCIKSRFSSCNPCHKWWASVPVSALEKAFPSVGKLAQIDVTQRSGVGPLGGRVVSVEIMGTTGAQIRRSRRGRWDHLSPPTMRTTAHLTGTPSPTDPETAAVGSRRSRRGGDLEVRDSLYIAGDWVVPVRADTIEVLDATTEEVIGRIPRGAAVDVDRAVRAARAAFDQWARTPPSERARYASLIAEGLGRRMPEISQLIAREVGTPLNVSTIIQVGLPIMTFASMAEIVGQIALGGGGRQLDGGPRARRGRRCHHALELPSPPDRCQGRTSARRRLHHRVEAERDGSPERLRARRGRARGRLAAGVFNLVSGTGAEAGEAIVRHRDLDMVSFTGSTRAGRRVAELAGATTKRVTLELGGKSATVILPDADFGRAVSAGITMCFLNSGQTCNALTGCSCPATGSPRPRRLPPGPRSHMWSAARSTKRHGWGPSSRRSSGNVFGRTSERGSTRAQSSSRAAPTCQTVRRRASLSAPRSSPP